MSIRERLIISAPYSAGTWWAWQDQDEWLITPSLNLSGVSTASLRFYSYVYRGSTYGDHYYIKVSTDGGSSWDIIEDFSGLSGGWDYFVTEWAYDLSSYVGQSINIAWHAYALGGLWYIWLVDDVVVDTTILSVSENPLGPSAKVEVWPNPSRGRVNFALPIGSVGEISIYEPSGRLVHSAKGVNEASFDLSRGIYFYRVVAEESVKTGTITVE